MRPILAVSTQYANVSDTHPASCTTRQQRLSVAEWGYSMSACCTGGGSLSVSAVVDGRTVCCCAYISQLPLPTM